MVIDVVSLLALEFGTAENTINYGVDGGLAFTTAQERLQS